SAAFPQTSESGSCSQEEDRGSNDDQRPDRHCRDRVAAATSRCSRRARTDNRISRAFRRESGITDFRVVEIYHVQAFAMFSFAFTELMQIRLPLVVLLKVFCGVLRYQNVTSVTAIHDALGDVDSGAGYVRLLVQIRDFVNRTTVDAHADSDLGMTF